MKIYLSPSNQTNNIYQDGKHTEQEVCYLIAQKVQDYLGETSIDTKLGNPKDSIYQRVAQSNSWNADYHICIHTNAGGGRGCEVFVYPSNENNQYVKNVYDNLCEVTPTTDRGIKTNTSLYEIKCTNAKCIYIECMFHDTEGDYILSHIDDIAYAIALGMCENKEDIKKTLAVETLREDTLYKVQVGAFTSEERAKAYAKDLKKKYNLDSFVVKNS